MSRRRSSHVSLQLFPFLAVLVCVMGALVFMLVLTSKRLRMAAIARARAALMATADAVPLTEEEPAPQIVAALLAPPAVPATVPEMDVPQVDPAAEAALAARRREELAAMIAEWQQRVQSLQDNRDQKQTAIQRQKLLVAAAERQVTKLDGELQALEAQLAKTTGLLSAGSQKADPHERERILLEHQIQQTRKQLKAAAQQARDAEGKFSIVPFDGKSGTTRRPILIECTAKGYRFLPEGIEILKPDIDGFTERYNPLLAGTLALINYWQQQNAKNGAQDDESQPYVLLIVRPSGTLPYYVSLKLLSALKMPHGYELVNDDVELQLPPVDPGAKAVCEATIRRLLAERQQIFQSAQPGMGRGGAGGGTQRGAPKPADSTEFVMEDLDSAADEFNNRHWNDKQLTDGRGAIGDKRPSRDSYSRAGGTTGSEGSAPRANAARPLGQPAPQQPQRVARSGATGGQAAGNAAGTSPAVAQSQATTSPAENLDDTQVTPQREDAPSPSRGNPTSANLRPGTPARPLGNGPAASRPATNGNRDRSAPSRDVQYEQLQRRRWGMFDDGAAIGREQSVNIRVDAERIIVGDSLVIPIQSGMQRTEMFDQLLLAIDHEVHTWGKPGVGFFWIPSLKFVISPGGNQVYDRISPLITRSGLRAEAQYTLDDAGPQPGESRR